MDNVRKTPVLIFSVEVSQNFIFDAFVQFQNRSQLNKAWSVTIDNKIIPAILTTFYQKKKPSLLKIVDYI